MSKEKKDRAIIMLPVHCEKWQTDYLDTMFQVANDIKNQLIHYEKNCYETLKHQEAFKIVQEELSGAYKDRDNNACKIPFYCEVRNQLIKEAHFSKGEFEKQIAKYSHHYKGRNFSNTAKNKRKAALKRKHKNFEKYMESVSKSRVDTNNYMIHTHVIQNIAADVWKAFRSVLYSKGKEVAFSEIEKFTTIRFKEHKNGIVFVHDPETKKAYFTLNQINFQVILDKKDPYLYQTNALKNEIATCNIVRRWYRTGWMYFLQIIYKGKAPVKIIPETGEILHPIGTGDVGHDIGTQTLASCGESDLLLTELAAKAASIQKELRRINRAMDRSRKATNPEFFDNTGQVIPIDELPKELLTKRKKRKWKHSKNYLKLLAIRRELYRKQAEQRVLQHNALANRVMRFGDCHYIEKMRFSALAKKAKQAKKNKNGKNLSRKRFGKSIANKAPATFVKILKRKVVAAGGSFKEVNTYKLKASQFNHLSQQYTKKSLSKRWNNMPDGKKIQRDMYSAFIIMNVDESLKAPDQDKCNIRYPEFVKLHDKEVVRLSYILTPSSTGIKKVS